MIANISVYDNLLRIAESDVFDRCGEMIRMNNKFALLAVVDECAEEKAGFRSESFFSLRFRKRKGKHFDVFCGIFELSYPDEHIAMSRILIKGVWCAAFCPYLPHRFKDWVHFNFRRSDNPLALRLELSESA